MKFFLIILITIYISIRTDAVYRRTCYYTNWAQYRSERFTISNIDANLCSHVIYAFTTIENNVIATTEWNDLTMYGEFAALRSKSPSIKLLLAIGGWNFNLNKLTFMLTNESTRAQFINSSIQFLRLNRFDGLDLDFEYPGRPPSPLSDRQKFTQFVNETKAAFDAEFVTSQNQKLLLTIAIPADISALDTGFEIEKISKNVDFITAMTYDYTYAGSKVTQHNSPLYADSNVSDGLNNINATINYLEKKSVPLSLINLGIPFYGRGFILTNPVDYGLGASVKSASPEGIVTKEIGFMAYYEILDVLKDISTKVYRFCDIQTPFFVKSNLWMGYDDDKSIENKMKYIKNRGLGGWSVWSLDLDDFKNAKYPLLTKLNQINDPNFVASSIICTNNTSLLTRTNIIPKTYRKSCYFTNWAQYRVEPGKFLTKDINATLCTHVIFAFATVKNNELTSLEYNDILEYKIFNLLRNKKPDIKLLLAVGGWNFNLTGLTYMLSTKDTRSEFINSTIKFLRENRFDGLDIDFEYPGRDSSPPSDKQKFTLFIIETRAAYDAEVLTSSNQRLLLTIAIPATKEAINSGFELAKIAKNVDYITLMTYDYSGSWSNYTGHNSPLYAAENLPFNFNNINATVYYFASQGVPFSSMNLGIAFYGRGYILKNATNFGLNSPVKSPNPGGPTTKEIGFLSYYEILKLVKDSATKVYRYCDTQTPFLVSSDLWVSYDDELSLENKMRYIINKELGGFSVWTLDLDDFKGTYGQIHPLLNKMNQIDEPDFLNNSIICTTNTLAPVVNTNTTSTPSVVTNTDFTSKVIITETFTQIQRSNRAHNRVMDMNMLILLIVFILIQKITFFCRSFRLLY